MKDPRNPFRLRRSESIDTEAAFLGLFEPGILDVMPEGGWAESVHVIRSASGGGKTSLIRLLTPGVLLALHARGTENHLKELHQRAKEIGLVGDTGPKVLGVMLLCGPGYSMLQDLEIEQGRRDRILFGLLNARIVLAALRSAVALRRLEFPKDVGRVSLEAPAGTGNLQGLNLPCGGREAYEWASRREAKICESLDSFGPLKSDALQGDDGLGSLAALRPDWLRIDGEPVAERVVLMMDDIQALTAYQRGLLTRTVIEARSPVGVWIAERFEALSTQELLGSGAHEGRDIEKPVEVERYWREKYQKFEKLTVKIADRRVRSAADTEMTSFRSCLEESLEGTDWEPTFEKACREVSSRVRALAAGLGRFDEWVAAREAGGGTPMARALAWRVLEILIEREIAKPQKDLFSDTQSMDEDELDQKDDSAVRNAAELFLAREYGLPYYFGAERISRLASLNIQQFLGLAGDVFEEAVGAEFPRRPTALPPDRQHAKMKEAARTMWDNIPKQVRGGRELRVWLESVGRFAQWYTYRPTAPNDRGVGGTAIRMSERDMLRDEETLRRRPDYRRFADLLASALAHNLLVADLDYNCKKEKWMVLNLNRLLCVHFDLPLGYGLYKEKPLATLCQWMDRPYAPPSTQEALV